MYAVIKERHLSSKEDGHAMYYIDPKLRNKRCNINQLPISNLDVILLLIIIDTANYKLGMFLKPNKIFEKFIFPFII